MAVTHHSNAHQVILWFLANHSQAAYFYTHLISKVYFPGAAMSHQVWTCSATAAVSDSLAAWHAELTGSKEAVVAAGVYLWRAVPRQSRILPGL